MSRRNQILWASALYASFAAIEIGHIGAGDWSHPLIATMLAVASAAAFVAVRRLRRSQPVAIAQTEAADPQLVALARTR